MFKHSDDSIFATLNRLAHLEEETPPKSVSDLPSVIQIRTQLIGMKPFVLLPGKSGREMRRTIEQIEKKLNALVVLVDKFYDLLGSKNWIFNDALPIDELEKILDTDDSDIAEQRLIKWYSSEDHLEKLLIILWRHAGLRARMPLIEKALDDYTSGRYYSTVFILLAQVDGFVNDYDPKNRRSLSSREADDMRAWDSATAIDDALPRVSKNYHKTFAKLSDDDVHEVYRNGIMHGELINFDNIIVASKAWNLLFAVADWAEAKEKQEEQSAAPQKKSPTWKELILQSRENRDVQRQLDEWKSYDTGVSVDDPDPSGLRNDCTGYCQAWRVKNYKDLARFVANPEGVTIGKLTSEVRMSYEEHPVSEIQLLRIENSAPAAAYVTLRITPQEGSTYIAKTHWTRILNGTNFDIAYPWQDGHWVLTQWALDQFRPA